MGHLLANCPNISRRFCSTEPVNEYTCFKRGKINLVHIEKISEKRRCRPLGVQCCSSTSISSADEKVKVNGKWGEYKGQLEYLVSEYGWKVRRLVEEEGEMRKVAQIQAQAFHVPVALFNDLFIEFFQAEVLSGLIYKLRNSPPDRYACLVTEPANEASESQQEPVGVVDVTVLRDESVLQHLQGAEEYLYVSGIAVFEKFRRQKIATVLLKACDMLSILWDFQYLALWAYEDDLGAQKLYRNAGYRVVSRDPPWMTTWIGRKRRVLMIKQSILKK